MRYQVLDGFRGYFLLMMMLVHTRTFSDTTVSHLNHHSFGWVEDAQGFVFISGIVIGIVFSKKLARDGSKAMVSGVFERIRTIYKYHLFIVVAITLAAIVFVGRAGAPAIFTEQFGEAPILFGILSAILVAGPKYVDILSMYIVFMLVTPAVILAVRKGWTIAVVSASFALWYFAQTGMVDVARIFAEEALGISEKELSLGIHFNRFSWQVLYVVGLVMGVHHAQGTLNLERLRDSAWFGVFLVAGGVCLYLACVQVLLHFDLLPGWVGDRFSRTVERGKLSTTYLFIFAAEAFVITWLLVTGPCSRFRVFRSVALGLWAVFNFRPLTFLGRHSLQVYAFHVLAIYALISSVDPKWFSDVAREILVIFIGLSLFIPAATHEWLQRSRRGKSVVAAQVA